MRRDDLPAAFWFLAVAAGYFAAAKFGMSLAFATKQVTAVWPPTGVAFVAVLLLGYRIWPGIWLGAMLANATASESLATAAGIATGNTLAGVLGVFLARRFVELDSRLSRLVDVLGLIVLGAALACTVSATGGVANLALGGIVPWAAYWSVWWVWWLGDAMGVLLFAPFLLSCLAAPRLGWRGRRLLELGALFTALSAVCHATFSGRLLAPGQLFRLEYTVFPFVIWAALRFGQREATVAGVLISSFAIWGAIHDRGPFAVGSQDQRLMLLDVFLAVVMITALTLSAVVAEGRRAEAALEGARDQLEARVHERTAELATANVELGNKNEERERLNLQLQALNTSLTGALREREVMLQEIHHRVKNNLQVISSLLNLQSRKLDAGENRDALEECRKRVQAIALIHEKLYQSADYAHVPFAEYVKSLTSSVFHAARETASNVQLELVVDDIALAVDRAIPCGLVLNELISNALKHGFKDGRAGTIRIELAKTDDTLVRLAVSNDGIALPDGFEWRDSPSLGLHLVAALASQLDGKLEVKRQGGTTFELTFPVPAAA